MNFNRSLTRNLLMTKTTIVTPAAGTAAQTRSGGANVKTTTKTTAATSAAVPLPLQPAKSAFSSISTASVGNNDVSNRNSYRSSFMLPSTRAFITTSSYSCCSASAINWSSSTMAHKNKKIMQQQQHQQQNSRGMYDSRAATAEVMPPLTSMSAQQISLTSRVNIMDTEVENRETAKPSATTNSPTLDTRKAPAVSASTPTQSCTASRNFCPSIKMPLRRLILTIMTVVVLSMEFTICGSSILEGRLTTILLSSNRQNSSEHIPAETINISSKDNGSLSNIPVISTTLTTMMPKSISPQFPLPISPAVFVPSMEAKSMKPLETAALIESTPSTTSPLTASSAVDTVESSPFLMSSLTDTTLMHGYPSTLDDVNASSELLSFPTSILNTYDGSDLPPLTEAEQAAKDLLTKGFSIPTYLPPFPVFAVADLPAYLNTVSTTTTEAPSNSYMESGDINSHENLLYYDNTGDHHHQQRQHRKLQIPRRNSSLVGANNVTVQEGNHAYLPCRIHRLQNKPVSWVRMRDGHIISVDQTTFIADQRFQAIFQDDKEYTWSLQIKYVQLSDEGWYECQASSEPKMSAKVYLKVVVPLTELIGDQSRFVKAGSKVALHCIVRGTLDPPQYIIWYRDKIQISENNQMGWYTQLDRNIFGHNGDNENTIGSLIIPFVRKMDSGNYTCQPSNSASVSVDLHVLSGEYSASAIMSAARTTYNLNDSYLLLLFLLMSLHNT